MTPSLKRKLLIAGAFLIAAAAVLGVGVWFTLFRLGPDPFETAGGDPTERYKYGSIGAEVTNGFPYWIWRALPTVFRDELPGGYESLGFVFEEGRATPIGIPVRDVGVVTRVGINCAICHSGTFRTSAQASTTVIPGAPTARMDIQGYQRFLTAAAASPKFTPDTLVPAMKEVHDMSLFEEALYRFVIIPGAKSELTKMDERNIWMDRNPDWGPGRIDPFNPVKFGILNQQVDETIGNADMMPNWALGSRDGHPLHWDGLNTSVREVIVSSALGDGAPPEAIDFKWLGEMQQYLSALKPPSYPLPIDSTLAQRGRTVYMSNCSACHGEPGQPPKLVAADEVGTDRFRVEMWGSKDADAYIQRYASFDWLLTHFQNVDSYLATTMEGLWLRGPYLHNGSVPTVADLLTPPDQRPKTFFRGNDVLDPVRMGFVSMAERDPSTNRPFSRYDTSLPGNSSAGHAYGLELSDDDKRALIEFLKTQ